MRQAVFLSSPWVWQLGHKPNHPLKPQRLQRTFERLRECIRDELPEAYRSVYGGEYL